MRGSVIKRGGSWSVVLDLGRDAAGKRIRHWHSGFRTRRDAERARVDLLSRVDRGAYVTPSQETVARFLQDWLGSVGSTVRPTTLAYYRMIVDCHLVPRIGGVPLQALTAGQINALYGTLLREGRRDGRGGLSRKSVRNVHMVLRRALADAVRWDRLVRNPADLADPPPAKRSDAPTMKTWTAPELRRFLAQVEGDRLYGAWVVAATTGMRRGEVLALRWRDVDLTLGRLSISQQVTTLGNRSSPAPRRPSPGASWPWTRRPWRHCALTVSLKPKSGS